MGGNAIASAEAHAYERGDAETRVVEPFAGVARGYQDVFYLRGTMVGVILLIGLAGLVPLWRRFGGQALLPWTLATGLLLAPAATAEFDYRYVLPAVPLAARRRMAFPRRSAARSPAGTPLRRGARDAEAPAAPEVAPRRGPGGRASSAALRLYAAQVEHHAILGAARLRHPPASRRGQGLTFCPGRRDRSGP